jgi:hypothetical protein
MHTPAARGVDKVFSDSPHEIEDQDDKQDDHEDPNQSVARSCDRERHVSSRVGGEGRGVIPSCDGSKSFLATLRPYGLTAS